MGAEVKILTGSAGSGKSGRIYEELVDAAYQHPEQRFYLIVPEQAGSSMEQRILSVNRERTGRAGFFNIDIIGFTRLAYRIFEEQGRSMRTVLEDYGKTILLRSVVGRVREKLQLYGGSVDRQGFIEELKSLFSEFLLFDIMPEDLEKALSELPEQGEQLRRKLSDVLTVYREFREDSAFLEQYMVAEELPAYLARLLAEPGEIRAVDGAVFYFDGFTGYTVAQRKVLERLTARASRMVFTVTLDPSDTATSMFGQSREMLQQLEQLAPGAEKVLQPAQPADTALKILTERVFRFPVRECTKDPSGEISVWQAANPLEELRVVAEDIRERVRKGQLRYRDVAILTADTEGLASYADLVMREYELPFFSDRTRTFVNNPIIDAQLFALELLDRDFTYESVFSFLKTGVLDQAIRAEKLDPGCVELLENHVIAHGIRGRKLWKLEASHFSCNDHRSDEEELQLEEIDQLRELFLSVLEPVLHFAGGKSYPVSRMIRGLRMLAEDPRLGLAEKGGQVKEELTDMGYPAEARAYLGIYEKYLSVLEKTEAILGSQSMTLHELRETLLIGVREIRIGVIPPTLDSVLIGDLERTRIHAVRALYVVGFNEGILPKQGSRGSILSERDREMLGTVLDGKVLAPDETEQRFREQFSLYLALSKASEHLTLTYSLKSRLGQEMEKSFLLGRIERIFPKLVEERRIRRRISGTRRPDRLAYLEMLRSEKGKDEDEEVLLAALAEVFPELSEVHAERPQGKEVLPLELMKDLKLRISISQMERYSSCPYAYFLRYILQLLPRRTHELQELDVGLIMHDALRSVFRKVKVQHGNDWRNLDTETLSGLTGEAVRDAVREMKPVLLEEAEEGGKAALILAELDSLAELTVEMQQRQLAGGQLLPDVLEGSFEAFFDADRPDGTKETVRIKGIVDRMDTLRPEEDTVYLRVLDYKTGDRKIDLRDLRDGRDLQLPIYTKILTEILRSGTPETIPVGMYYYHVTQPMLKSDKKKEPEAVEAGVEKELKLRGILNVSPTAEEESGLPSHFYVELQEQEAVDQDRKLCSGRTLPVKKEDEPYAGSVYATTGEMEALGDYALHQMKNLSEQILKGDIRKYPTRKEGARENACKRCDAAAVCRFRREDSREHFVAKVGDNKELLERLVTKGQANPVALDRMRMLEEIDEEVLREMVSEDRDEENEDEEI